MLDWVLANIWTLLIVLNYIVALSVMGFLLMHNRNPHTTMSYILALVILPFVGIIIYLFFGQEYRKTKIFRRKYVFDNSKIKKWEKELLLDEEELEYYEEKFLDHKVRLVRLIQKNEKSPLTFKNEVDVIINGENKFESLFKDLKKAQHHIHVEYYIIRSDTIGNRLIDILCDKAKEGVDVRVSYDYVGSELTSKLIKKMRDCGIAIQPFMPVWFPNLTRKLNYRDHRKIVVIDGAIGYVGGINVSDTYVNGLNETYWRDTHLRIKGHAVKSLQSQFLLNWDFVSGEDESIKISDSIFPKVIQKGKVPVQIAASGPDTDWANIMEAIFTAITTAEEYVYITTPYFIPNEPIITALKAASRGGIDVRVMIPDMGDSWAAKYASNSYLESLLESDVRVYRYCKGMLHAKTIVVDDSFATVGTSNMDYRSFNINFEINALIYDSVTTQKLLSIYKEDLKECKEIDLNEWRNRPFGDKLKESFCRLWAPLL